MELKPKVMAKTGSTIILLLLLFLNDSNSKPVNSELLEWRLPVINFEQLLIKESSVWQEYSHEEPGLYNIRAIDEALLVVQKYMTDEPNIKIEIRGHCNYTEWAEVGQSLCFNRAFFIREKLMDNGIPESRMEINASNNYVLSSGIESVEDINNLEEGQFKTAMQQLHQGVSFMTIK